MKSRDQLRAIQVALTLASAVGVLSVVILFAWGIGHGSALALDDGWVPTAPLTGLMTLALSVMIVLALPRPEQPRARAVGLVLIALVAVSALSVLVSFALHVDNPLEALIVQREISANGIVIGRVGPWTAVLTLVLTLGCSLCAVGGRARQYAALLHLSVVMVGTIILQSYVLDSPLLYTGTFIPVAAPTALLLTALATAGVLATGMEQWPLRLLSSTAELDQPGLAKTPYIWLAVMASAFLVTSGGLWYAGERQRLLNNTASALARTVEIRADEIATWYDGTLSTARTVARTRIGSDDLAEMVSPDSHWLRGFLDDGVAAAALFDATGALLAHAPAADSLPGAATRLRELVAAGADSITADDVRRFGNRLLLDTWVPVGNGPRPIAWLLLRLDPRQDIVPRVTTPPRDIPRAEILLWRNLGDSIVALTDVPNRSTEEHDFVRLRDSTIAGLMARAQKGTPFVAEGDDYRGVEVVAGLAPVRGTNWVLLAKVDRSTVFTPAREAVGRLALLLIVLLGATSGAIRALAYRREVAVASRQLELVRSREQSVADLQRSELRYARALRATNDAIWEMDLATDGLYVSPRFLEMVGITEHDTLTVERDFYQRIFPDDVERTKAAITAHLRTSSRLDLELRIVDGLGQLRWIWLRGEAERDEAGRPTRIFGAITDVSARHQFEESLRRVERILRIRSAVSVSLSRATSENELLHAVVDIAVSIGGYRMAWIGFAVHDDRKSMQVMAVAGDERGYLTQFPVTWDEASPTGRGPTGRCVRTGTAQVAQSLLTEPGFAPWWEGARERGFASSTSIPINVKGETIGALMLYAAEHDAFSSDEMEALTELGSDLAFGISAQRDHAAVVAEQERAALFRRVMDESADAIYIADFETATIFDFNDSAYESLGYTADELRALHPFEIATDYGDAESWRANAVEALDQSTGVQRRTHRRKDGSTFPVEVSRAVITIGERKVVLAMARDITDVIAREAESAKLQDQLLRAQRMESVGRLAGGIAHDFNNLLTVINTTADLALAELPESAPLRHDILGIRAAGQRAATLTRQLLAFSRQQVLRRVDVDINALIKEFDRLVRRVIGEDISITLALHEKSLHVLADPGQIEQVLMNLCVNARDAMPQGGSLTIATSEVEVDEATAAHRAGMAAGRFVLLSITDTGSGMSQEVQDHIFDPFFTTKEPGKGTGLGLSTVYGIIKQSGGSIWVNSRVGVGTTFEIYLPLTEPRVQVARSTPSGGTEAPESNGARGAETILIVEDESSIRLVVNRVLSKAGYNVLEATEGREALERIKAHQGTLNLVMTDLVMPGMTGIELARTLRERFPRLPILLATGYSAEALSTQISNRDGFTLISKPYSVQDLLREIRRTLDAAKSEASA